MAADKFFKFYKKYGLFVVFAIIFIIFSIVAEGFLNPRNLINILKQASIYGVMCVGVTIVMVSGGMDMSDVYKRQPGYIKTVATRVWSPASREYSWSPRPLRSGVSGRSSS